MIDPRGPRTAALGLAATFSADVGLCLRRALRLPFPRTTPRATHQQTGAPA